MSAANQLQRAMERGDRGRMCALSPTWGLAESFEALDHVDDTMGTEDLPSFLETFDQFEVTA